ncbi:MAG: hypothetical protein ACD_51C00200G0005 [uncultured bacterium]|nr:MAG: hypothetical protein ACD_51C00200G0005 [uncultured bacterium]OGJ47432.1 MAG: hypothetical protein A2244_01720 [Candidatus Peregrinibacteria bacterium RIFOXYA2_FULL_41_18]OGJ49460.1 MAG: hypothetical protein A2344_00310 [Candidatus Peregrinibacteria bacterium RIFOXYB12_FULL_41_12]OGJ53361.1 MAG: hypothetical protein A2448_01325 [Candidatus Peregrinibacteria bacterium RIFOXYC2_FULL_41_22]OGJ54360.1 MAG: hypothetical protein A2336_00195 [Candidatus Peregrinibacteria bacterium RIFOXYB2_FULL
MLLDCYNIYEKEYFSPYTSRGVIIDSSVMITLVDGLIDARISKRKPNKSSQYWKLLHFLDLICLPNNWDKFSITPHILTEVCSYLRNNYSKHRHYKDIVKEVSPFLAEMREELICKSSIIGHPDFKNAIIEVGDISISIVADDFVGRADKIAILSVDHRLNDTYVDNPNVLVMDFVTVVNNLL